MCVYVYIYTHTYIYRNLHKNHKTNVCVCVCVYLEKTFLSMCRDRKLKEGSWSFSLFRSNITQKSWQWKFNRETWIQIYLFLEWWSPFTGKRINTKCLRDFSSSFSPTHMLTSSLWAHKIFLSSQSCNADMSSMLGVAWLLDDIFTSPLPNSQALSYYKPTASHDCTSQAIFLGLSWGGSYTYDYHLLKLHVSLSLEEEWKCMWIKHNLLSWYWQQTLRLAN